MTPRSIPCLATFLFVFVETFGLPCSALHAQTTTSKIDSLFDGQTLKGWDYDANHWRVDGGAIVGEIPPGESLAKNTWMVWQDGILKDFDLRLQVKLTGAAAANSGIQFRCQAKNPDHVSGYQADLDMGATWLGRIYDEHGRALLVERGQRVLIGADGQRTAERFAPAGMFAAIFRENDWNDCRIVAIGPRIAVYVNGTLFSELVDHQTDAQDLSGQLALQLHSGPETRVEFRDIELENLASSDPRLGKFPLSEKRRVAFDAKQVGQLPRGTDGKSLNLDFEAGNLQDWTATGDAFQGQPVNRDTIGNRWRGQISNKQGDYFIGGYEITLSDAAQGTLTSPWFEVKQPYASFLIAGGRAPATRVEVIARQSTPDSPAIKETVIATAGGDQREQMRRFVVDLRKHQGQTIAVRLVDASSGGWGHLNFDDFRFHAERPQFADSIAASPLDNPLLHHLKANPASGDVTGDTLSKMSVPDGFSVELIAAEPDVHQPMAFTFDAQGRLWVVEGHSYPTKRPEGKGIDKILILEDANHDGVFETRKVFQEGLNLVSGLQVGHGGVWIGAAPELLFIPDRDQDDVPDGEPVVLLDGFGFADTHETINSLIWGPDGWLYGNQGVFNQAHVGKPGGDEGQRVRLSAGVWRYHPTRHTFEVFAHGGSNQWGLDFDIHGQLFMTHCRSHFGKGPTTHVVQGGHYWNQLNSGYAPFISANPVAGIPKMRNYLPASARYGHGEGGAGKRGSRALYGGHSHVGTMIYLGDNWPAEYRNHLFTHNLHGHRINHQVNRREGSSFNTLHAGYDVFHCADPQYIGVDLQYGPDGAVYISDWYDPRHCHSPHTEQWQRGNGRIYRMQYKGYQPANVDYQNATDLQLAQTQLHPNEWHVRIARLVLAQRAADGKVDEPALKYLRDLARNHSTAAARLRGLWSLHVVDQLDSETAQRCLHDESEFVRGWTIQLLAEAPTIESRESMILKSLQRESSPIVKQYLASAASRLSSETAWTILETLAQQSENASDRKLPLLIWHALASRLASDLSRANDLIDSTEIPQISQYLRWYTPQLSDEAREMMTARLAQADPPTQIESLRLFAAGLAGTRNLKQPDGWSALAEGLYRSDATRGPAETLGAAFGDPVLYKRMRSVLASADAPVQSKKHALSVLASDNDDANLNLLLDLIDTVPLRAQILKQLKGYGDPRVAEILIDRMPQLPQPERESAMETLCSRAGWAVALLDAIESGQIPEERLTSYYARQIASLDNQDVLDRLSKQWGKLGQSSHETKAEIAKLVDAYNKAPLWAYNRGAGAAHYKKLCANCHESTPSAKRIGPKLAGSGAKGIDYIVENILDPNAVIGKDFQARKILTVDGQVITGVLMGETDSAVTIRTATTTETLAKDDIERIAVSENSFMPEGLLKPLNDRQRIELLMHLMSLR